MAPSRAFVGAIVFAVAVSAFSRIPLLPDIGADLTLTAGEIGLLSTAFGLGRLFTDLPAGRLAGAVVPAAALAVSGVALAGACALLAGAGSFGVALLASVLIGCASALTNTTGMFAFATATTAERRGASMAIYTTALMSGQMVGPALGGMLGTLAGWRPAMVVAAGVGAAVAVGSVVSWRRALRVAEPTLVEARDRRQPRVTQPRGYADRAELVALAAAPFATFFGMAGLTQTLIPLIGDGELGLDASTIGIAIALGAAARFAGAWTAGVASDRLSRKVVLIPSLVLMACGAAVLIVPPTEFTWGTSIALLALGSSGVSVAAAAVADRVPPARLGHELGLFRLIGDFGLLIGPAITGFAYGASGPELAGLLTAAVFTAAALAAMLFVAGEPPHAPSQDTGEIVLD